MGPCTNAKYPLFSQFEKKNPDQKINFNTFQQLYQFSFIWMFFLSI